MHQGYQQRKGKASRIRIRQAICKMCGKSVNPGAGKWIEIGRVHKDQSRCFTKNNDHTTIQSVKQDA